MYGRTRAEREWMAEVAAQMIRDELLDDETEDWEDDPDDSPGEVECPVCKGVGVILIATGDEVSCDTCEGTGLLK